ncbi:MAG: EAL domain-containing protein [Nitriliruptoraceae bacterium]
MARSAANPQSTRTARLLGLARWQAWTCVLVFCAAIAVGIIQFNLAATTGSFLLVLPVTLAAIRLGTRASVLVAIAASAIIIGDAALDGATMASLAAVAPLFAAIPVLFIVAWLTGGSITAMEHRHQQDVAAWWESELEFSSTPTDDHGVVTDDRVRRMVATADFYPVFQPIYALDDGRLLAAEALTRFDSEPPVSPAIWFARAADLGLGTDLELAAVRKAIDACRSLSSHVAVSVNASAATFVEPLLLDIVASTPRTVMLELTELEPVTDYTALRSAIDRLRQAGARFAIDNVGASMTSLRHIGRLAPDVIKLDGALTNDTRGDPMRWSLTRRLLRYARSSNVALIAEGIEVAEDLAAWRELGVLGAQGYLLGRPGTLAFPDPISFPSPRRTVRSVRPQRNGRRSRADDVEDTLAPSQLGEHAFFGHDITP